MKKHGVQVFNHHPVVELARVDGRIAGALALDISTPEPGFALVKSPNVIVSTGLTHRLYTNAATPSRMFNTSHCPNCAGGQALGWRAGAKMVNMELPYTHAGIKYFQRAGKATWGGVLRDPQGTPVGPFVTRPDNRYGDPVVDVYQDIFMDYRDSARGPVYMDCTGLDREGVEYMTHWLENEGNCGILDFFKKEGLDIGSTPVEFRSYDRELSPRGGILYDENARTSLKATLGLLEESLSFPIRLGGKR